MTSTPPGDSNQQQNEQQQHTHEQQIQEQQQQSEQVPNEVAAALTVKIGGAARTSRRQLAVARFSFLLSDGFDVLRAKADGRTARELRAAGERFVREDAALYIRPGAHSKQAELVALTVANFEARVARSYRNFLRRKPGAERFECELVTYVRKDAGGQRPRSAASAGPSPTPAPADYYSAVAADYSTRQSFAYEAGHSNAAYGNHLGGKRKRSDAPSMIDEGQRYKTVRMIMNGVVVPVSINVNDLLACFATVGQNQQQQYHNGGNPSTTETESMHTSSSTANKAAL